MNKVNIIGRLVKEPDIKYTQSENPLCIARMTVAIDRRFKREGEPEADFLPVVVFGKTAEFVEKYFSKGLRVGVSGRIQTGKYDKDDGTTVYTTDIVAEEVHFADGKRDASTTTGGGGGNDDDDIPF